MIQITCKGNSASCTRTERLTSGMVGLQCEFVFDGAWDGLAKTAVFTAGNEKRDVLLQGAVCTVPWEVLKTAGYQLVIGVYGTNAAGTLVIPTCYAMCGGITSGADPSGDESTDPTLPVWGQMQGMIGDLGNLATSSKDNLVAAINEAAKSGGEVDTTLSISGKAADAKAVGDALAVYVLLLSTDKADAQANSDAVTAAIAEHKHVVLKQGDYPVKPGIVIESGKLDMNGAHFYTVDYKSSTPLVYLKGEAPEICNGELEGSYDLADDEEGYEFFESESLIFPYGVNDAYIHHMELHNNWGYCISTGTETEKAQHYVGTATQIPNDNDIEFITDPIEIPEGYKYVTASGQVGYNRIISRKDVHYHFFDEAGTEIRGSEAVPKARIAIPSGAKTVKITTRLDDETFMAYNVYFTNYRESLTVSDCKFRNFHSLGLAGFEGTTKVVGCSFIESGKPRSDATPTGRATTGGVDIEDTPCPEFYMANCYSRDCAKLLMFGGYKGVVTNCIGDMIGAYRGWHLDISDCNISNLYTMGAPIRITVNGVHAYNVDIKEANRKDVCGSISTNFFPLNPSLDCFDSFIVEVLDHNSTGGVVSGVLNGKIKSVTTGGIRWKGFAPAKGSQVIIDETVVGDVAKNRHGILGVTGDAYGIDSNTAFVPNGHTIHDSTFTIADVKSGYMTETAMSGAFENCVFNLTGATYFKNSNATCSNPIDLTFTNCIINNADYHLFNFVPAAGGTVTFKNCTIADESKLFNGDASSMTVNILPGGEGGHWETVLETVWEQDVITPTAFDSETGIFTCAAGELDNLELNTEYAFYSQCTKEGIAYNTILTNENVNVTKLSDTTFSIDVTPPTTFVPTNIKFSRGACLAITDIDAKKIRLTLDGQFHPTATLYDIPFYKAEVPYFGRNTGYIQIRNAYQAYQQVTAEVESPYRIVGKILCGFNAPSNSGNFHFKNNSFCCPLVPSYLPEGTDLLNSDGTKIAKLYSTSAPWHIGTSNDYMAILNDYLKIISGTKVKLERWVE